jgi:hypothetical protein
MCKPEHPSPHYELILEAIDRKNGCLLREVYDEYVKLCRIKRRQEVVTDVFYVYVEKMKRDGKVVKIEEHGKTGVTGRSIRVFI